MSPSASAHITSLPCAVEPARALRFLADGRQLGRWALGCMNTVRVATGLYKGISLFDGSVGYVRPVLDQRLAQVDYWVGGDAHQLSPRITARVLPHRAGCLVSLAAWRSETMSDARWARLIACHEAEIHLVQALLEHNRRPARRPTAS
jgi:hypothetical protein